VSWIFKILCILMRDVNAYNKIINKNIYMTWLIIKE
jgi:hypothetical protein